MATELTRARREAKVSGLVRVRVRRESEEDVNPRKFPEQTSEGRRAGCGDSNRRDG